MANQFWYHLGVQRNRSARLLPAIWDAAQREKLDVGDVQNPDNLLNWADSMVAGAPFLWRENEPRFFEVKLYNVSVSECFNCNDISIWVYDRLVYPQRGEAPPANPDLSDDIRRDYDEASTILDKSPRGAAALIRLAIQKLCKELGQSGKNINVDIAALVADGLDPRVQQALDIVRVVGNDAVHPGQIDLRDDRATAEMLFGLLNVIAEKTISVPKRIEEVYGALPEDARDAIAKRDANT